MMGGRNFQEVCQHNFDSHHPKIARERLHAETAERQASLSQLAWGRPSTSLERHGGRCRLHHDHTLGEDKKYAVAKAGLYLFSSGRCPCLKWCVAERMPSHCECDRKGMLASASVRQTMRRLATEAARPAGHVGGAPLCADEGGRLHRPRRRGSRMRERCRAAMLRRRRIPARLGIAMVRRPLC